MAKQKAVKDTPKPSNKKKSTIQGCIPFTEIYEDGIIRTNHGYSKAYAFQDINFVMEEEDKQEEVLLGFERFLNKFNTSVAMQIIIFGKKLSDEDTRKKFLFEKVGYDGNDEEKKKQNAKDNEWRDDLNAIISDKIKGGNYVEKKKYCILTVRTDSYDTALQQFNSLDSEMKTSFQNMGNSHCEPLSLYDFAKLLYDYYHVASDIPFEKVAKKYIHHDEKSIDLSPRKIRENATTLKNIIAPTEMRVEDKEIHFQRIHGVERVARTLMTVDFPPSLDTKFLNTLITVPCEMAVSLNLEPYTRKVARNKAKTQNNSVKGDVIKAQKSAFKQGYSPELISDELILDQQEAKELRKDIIVDGKKLFRVTLMYTLFGNTSKELDEYETALIDKASDCGDVHVTPCRKQQLNAFNNALPLGASEISLGAGLTSASCCAFNPFNIQELIDSQGYFYGINSNSKSVITYSRKRSSLANGLILGQAGSGKSFLAKSEMISTMLSTNDLIITLDPENEYCLVFKEFGGITVDLKSKSPVHINPCDLDLEFEDTDASPLTEKCDYMVSLVESMLGNGRECNAHQVNAIHKATEEMYKPYIAEMERRYAEGDKRGLDRSICPTLEDFFKCLVNLGTPEAINLTSSIEPYCMGQYNLFAHKTNFNSDDIRFLNFNLLHLPEKMKEVAMKVILSYVWTKIVQNKEAKEKAKRKGLKYDRAVWVYLDEFHLFFKTKSSADAIMSYYKRARKYNGIMTGITQDISDLLNNEQGTAMYNNTGFFAVMKQSTIGRQQWQNLFQCSDVMIDNIKDKPSGIGLISNNKVLVPFDFKLPNESKLYKLISTNPNDN